MTFDEFIAKYDIQCFARTGVHRPHWSYKYNYEACLVMAGKAFISPIGSNTDFLPNAEAVLEAAVHDIRHIKDQFDDDAKAIRIERRALIKWLGRKRYRQVLECYEADR